MNYFVRNFYEMFKFSNYCWFSSEVYQNVNIIMEFFDFICKMVFIYNVVSSNFIIVVGDDVLEFIDCSLNNFLFNVRMNNVYYFIFVYNFYFFMDFGF